MNRSVYTLIAVILSFKIKNTSTITEMSKYQQLKTCYLDRSKTETLVLDQEKRKCDASSK